MTRRRSDTAKAQWCEVKNGKTNRTDRSWICHLAALYDFIAAGGAVLEKLYRHRHTYRAAGQPLVAAAVELCRVSDRRAGVALFRGSYRGVLSRIG